MRSAQPEGVENLLLTILGLGLNGAGIALGQRFHVLLELQIAQVLAQKRDARTLVAAAQHMPGHDPHQQNHHHVHRLLPCHPEDRPAGAHEQSRPVATCRHAKPKTAMQNEKARSGVRAFSGM
jgi:hypothetical protein